MDKLKGRGFLLESPYMKEGVDIRKEFGCAYLLYPGGKRTGYWLMNHGLRTDFGGCKCWYQLEKSF